MPMESWCLIAIGTWPFLFATLYLLEKILAVGHHPSEPPLLAPKIPLIGHALPLWRSKVRYCVHLRTRYALQAVSILLPGIKIYVLWDPALVAAAQKVPDALSFRELERSITMTLGNLNQHARAKLRESDKFNGNLFDDLITCTHRVLMPGEILEEISVQMADEIASSIERLTCSRLAQIDLWAWIRCEVLMSVTKSIYGPRHPFENTKVKQSFSQFTGDIVPLLLGVMPALLAPKGHDGRALVVNAFRQYFEEGGHLEASALIKQRQEIMDRYGFDADSKARMETVHCIALLTSTLPTAFWTVFNTFSDSSLLHRIRRDATRHGLTAVCNDQEARQLSISKLRSSDLFASLLNESLRNEGTGVGARMVNCDVTLANRWLLRKGSILLMPHQSLHFNTAVWGVDANEWSPDRFTQHGKRSPSVAFQGFGGGKTKCPGSIMAASNILVLVAILALDCDLTPVSGSWTRPKIDLYAAPAATPDPIEEVQVLVSRRKEGVLQSWRVVA